MKWNDRKAISIAAELANTSKAILNIVRDKGLTDEDKIQTYKLAIKMLLVIVEKIAAQPDSKL